MNSDKPFDICERTFEFSVRIVNLCSFLKQTPGVGRDLAKQLIRSGTSIGANVEESRAASPFGKVKKQKSKVKKTAIF